MAKWFKGHFKTAYLQREIPIDVAVVAPASDGNGNARNYLMVGELVTLEPADADTPAYVYKATGTDAATVLTNATHIVAQSDMSLNSHIPVELGDWKYEPVVMGTLTGGTAPTLVNNPTKHIALWAITDEHDIIVDEITY